MVHTCIWHHTQCSVRCASSHNCTQSVVIYVLSCHVCHVHPPCDGAALRPPAHHSPVCCHLRRARLPSAVTEQSFICQGHSDPLQQTAWETTQSSDFQYMCEALIHICKLLGSLCAYIQLLFCHDHILINQSSINRWLWVHHVQGRHTIEHVHQATKLYMQLS